MNGFLSLIDLSLNIKRGLHSIRDLSGGLAAMMIVGLTIAVCTLVPLVWYFDISSTLDYADGLIRSISPTITPETRIIGTVVTSLTPPDQNSASLVVSYLTLMLTIIPTVVELFFPRIGEEVQAVGFMVFAMIGLDMATDMPRIVTVMNTYYPSFSALGWFGIGLWYVCFPIVALFASLLFEMLLIIFVVMILALVFKIAAQQAKVVA